MLLALIVRKSCSSMEHQLSLSSDNYIELVLCLVFELIREMRMGISTKMKPCDMI